MGNMPVVEVGGRKVRVKRLLSEGGYAHVYKVSGIYWLLQQLDEDV